MVCICTHLKCGYPGYCDVFSLQFHGVQLYSMHYSVFANSIAFHFLLSFFVDLKKKCNFCFIFLTFLVIDKKHMFGWRFLSHQVSPCCISILPLNLCNINCLDLMFVLFRVSFLFPCFDEVLFYFVLISFIILRLCLPKMFSLSRILLFFFTLLRLSLL